MRVIAGKYRSRILKAADHFRPTTDRVRESLFNILQNEIQDSIFVDAFAGSGSVGIEAISRGAANVFFVESNRKALRVLEQNLEFLVGESWRILTLDAWKALTVLPQQTDHVDIFFFDPPYEFHQYSKLLTAAGNAFGSALYVVEHSSRTDWEAPPEFENVRTTAIGETQLRFFRKVLQDQDKSIY